MAKEADKTTDKPVVNGTDRKMSSMERAVLHAMGENKTMGNQEDPAKERYPELWAWISTVHVGRDKLKTPASISVRLGPEGVLITLTDRDLAVSIDATCPTLDGVYAALESALASKNPAIKTWGKKEANLRKRKSSS